MPAPKPQPSRRHPGLLLIALYEFTKGLVLVLFAISLLRMMNQDLQAMVTHWAHLLRLNVQNRVIADLCVKAGLINPREMVQFSALSFFIGALHLTQGVGLYLEKRWAEYLTVVATAAFIPLEIYELCRHVTPVRGIILLGNVGLVIYLALLLRREKTKHGDAPSANPERPVA